MPHGNACGTETGVSEMDDGDRTLTGRRMTIAMGRARVD